MQTKKRVLPIHNGYEITPDGQVFNIKHKAWLKPFKSNVGYYGYKIAGKTITAHKLVMITYNGPAPVDGLKYEIDHIDEDKGNNHYSNLQWISHAANVRKSFKLGKRGCWWLNKSRPSFTLEHRRKMANAKFKPVKVYRAGKLFIKLPSLNATAEYFNKTRVYMWLIIKHREGKYKEFTLMY